MPPRRKRKLNIGGPYSVRSAPIQIFDVSADATPFDAVPAETGTAPFPPPPPLPPPPPPPPAPPPPAPPPPAPPPPAPPPATPVASAESTHTVRTSLASLPKGLQRLGNAERWRAVLSHVGGSQTSHTPLVVWGPTGCGKTCGVRQLFRAMNYVVYELDGSDGESTAELLAWIKRSREVSTLQGPTAVFLDDFESFTDDARRRVARLLQAASSASPQDTAGGETERKGRKKKKPAPLSPIVITCTQFREPRLKDLRGFADVRLFAPYESTCTAWFDANGFLLPSSSCEGEGTVCRPERGWHAREKAALVSRDLRRVNNALVWRHLTGTSVDMESNSTFSDSFQATRQLLLRRTEACRWIQTTEPRDADLLREHIPHYTQGDVDVLADVLADLAVVDSLVPFRYECYSVQIPFNMQIVARSILLHSRARDVGALRPPSFPSPSWGAHTGTPTAGGRPRTTVESLEIPKLLYDRR